MSGMCMHCDARYVTDIQDIYDVPVPMRTESWTPLGHGIVRDSLVEAIGQRGFTVEKERWALSDARKKRAGQRKADENDPTIYTGDGARAFGLMEVKGADDFNLAVAIRNSLDKTLALGIAVGASVFICDNLILSGDIVTYRRHTSRIDLDHETNRAVASILPQFDDFKSFLGDLKQTPVRDSEFDTIVCDSLRRGILPGMTATDVLQAWHENKGPQGNEEFATRLQNGVYEDRNAWTAHGLFTDLVFKRQTLTAQGSAVFDSQRKLNEIFAARLPLDYLVNNN